MAEILQLPLPPHSGQNEQALLGSLLIDQKAWFRVCDQVSAADFFREDHRLIFAAIAQLRGERKDHDIVTVADQLERTQSLEGAGGYAYLGMLARDTPSSDNAETYATVVRDQSAKRRLRELGEGILRSVGNSNGRNAVELLADVQEQAGRLQSRARRGRGLVGSKELVRELVDDLERRRERSLGLSLGLPDFDSLTYGLEPGDLVVIAARPGMGKTALLVSIANAVSAVVPVVVFSAEMPSMQLMRRCLSLRTRIPQGSLRRTERLTREQWQTISAESAELAGLSLSIDDTSSPTLTHIRAECISKNAQTPLGLILVDYVQLVVGNGANRYEQLRDAAYGLKALAKDLAVPIIILAQLNRGVESREHKRPFVSDLRDSGAIEEAADIVGLLYSESHYKTDFGMPYVLECEIAKNRNGERGECLWRFEGAFSRVTALDDGARAQYRQQRIKAQRKNVTDP